MINKAISFIILASILFSTDILAVDATNQLLQKNLEAANTQIEVLKAQVQTMQSYQDNFLSTVYWSLGITASIVVILVGYSWFTNFRLQEKELANLKQHIENDINDEKLKIDESINQKISDLNLSFQKSLDNKINTNSREIKSNLDSLKKKIMRINYAMKEEEYNKWKEKKIFDNSMITLSEMLEIATQINYEYLIDEILEFLVQDLKLLCSTNENLDSYTVSQLMIQIDKLSKEHIIAIDTIKNLLLKVK